MPEGEATFRFTCLPTCWGRCCHKMDLPLFPWDVVSLARGLGATTREVLATHALVGHDRETAWPSLRLKAVRMGPCAFLDQADGTCRVYGFRPDVCRTYPLAREWPPAGDDIRYRRADQPRCPQGACAHGTRAWTVPEWLIAQAGHPVSTLALRAYFRLQRRALQEYRFSAWATPEVARALGGLLFDQDGVRQQSAVDPAVDDVEMHRRCMAAADLFLRFLAQGAGYGRGPAPRDLARALETVLQDG